MSFEQKDNSGALFRNKRKLKDTHPDRTGSATIDGVEYWLSGWLKTPKDGGEQFLSLSIKRKDEERSGAGNSVRAGSRENLPDDFDEEIPF